MDQKYPETQSQDLKKNYPVLLPDFQDFLRKRKLALEKILPFFALWLHRFLEFRGKHPELTEDVRILEF